MQIKDNLQPKVTPYWVHGKKHILVFSHIFSLVLAAPSVTIILPHIVVISAIKGIRNAMLLKCSGDRITSYSAGLSKEEKENTVHVSVCNAKD